MASPLDSGSMAGANALCSWQWHLTLILPLFTQVYKCLAMNLINAGLTLQWTSREKLWPDGLLDLNVEFTLPHV